MTASYFKRHSKSFFRGKKARLLEERTNFSGQTIAAGEVVTILGKTDMYIYEECFNIMSETNKEIEIHGVSCEVIELLTEKK